MIKEGKVHTSGPYKVLEFLSNQNVRIQSDSNPRTEY